MFLFNLITVNISSEVYHINSLYPVSFHSSNALFKCALKNDKSHLNMDIKEIDAISYIANIF